jgi:peptide/nickel transport system ATP-binding protein
VIDNTLKINKLKISTKTKVLVDISFNIGSSTALVGQSGSGKSITLKTFLDMLPNSLEKEFSYSGDFKLTKQNIGYVPQNPFTSLSPLTKISKQFFCSKERQLELLDMVDVPIDSLDKFPMQLSGGQLQRIVIAIALNTNPKLLLLDEPTTALDSESKTNILKILQKVKKKLNLKILFVTHDIMSVSDICDDIIILKDGQICEQGDISDILRNPKHNYTKQLLESSFKNREFQC